MDIFNLVTAEISPDLELQPVTKLAIPLLCLIKPPSQHDQPRDPLSQSILSQYNQNLKHFTCLKCSNLAIEPLECSRCSGLICKSCIERGGEYEECWQTFGSCKAKLKKDFAHIHPFVLKHMRTLRVRCKNDGCSKKDMSYDQAIVHL